MKLILLGVAPAQTLELERVWRNVRLIVSPRVRSSPVALGDTRPRRLRGPRCPQVTEYLEDVAQNDNTNKQKCRKVGQGKTQGEKL